MPEVWSPMAIKVPGTLFEQFHSGWKFIAAHIEGADLRFCIENPSKNMFLSFRIEKKNEPLLYDCLRLTHGDKEEPGLLEKKRLETDDIGQGCTS